jgi:hypothetical protein
MAAWTPKMQVTNFSEAHRKRRMIRSPFYCLLSLFAVKMALQLAASGA